MNKSRFILLFALYGLASCLSLFSAPPPFLFPGAQSITEKTFAGSTTWTVRRSDGSTIQTRESLGSIQFSSDTWRLYNGAWRSITGGTWLKSGNTWALGTEKELSQTGRTVVLLDSGIRHTYQMSVPGTWQKISESRAVPIGANSTGTINDMIRRQLAAKRKQAGYR